MIGEIDITYPTHFSACDGCESVQRILDIRMQKYRKGETTYNVKGVASCIPNRDAQSAEITLETNVEGWVLFFDTDPDTKTIATRHVSAGSPQNSTDLYTLNCPGLQIAAHQAKWQLQ